MMDLTSATPAAFFNRFIYFYFCLCTDFSLVAEHRGYSLIAMCELLIAVASLLVVQVLREWALVFWSTVSMHGLTRCVGSVAQWQVGSSWTRD